MDESSNSNRVALISGANRGIGAEIAKELVSHGFRVSLGARRPESLVECHGPETGDMVYNAFDAFDRSSAEEWVKNTVRHFNRIDALVNNAGSDERVSITDDNEEALDRLWEVNVKAPLRMCRLCLPHLEQTGRGRIINISSLSGKRAKKRIRGLQYDEIRHDGFDPHCSPRGMGQGRSRYRDLSELRANTDERLHGQSQTGRYDSAGNDCALG